MLVSITWSDYSVAILITLVIYYSIIGVMYYKDVFYDRFFRKKNEQEKPITTIASASTGSNPERSGRFFESEFSDESKFGANSLNASQSDLFTPTKSYSSISESDDTLQRVRE